MSGATGLPAIEASLRRRFRVAETDIQIGDRLVSILHPASAEDLIDEREFDRDERLPYWAELWPSSRILGEHVLGLVGNGRTLIELGCGSGLVATCAALAGFDTVVSDYYEDALRFARVNAWRNGAPAPRGLLLDWRYLPAKLPRFQTVIASDVLYEKPYGVLVAKAIAATLAKDGVALVADPGRVGRDDFIRSLDQLGLTISKRSNHAFRDGPVRQTIAIFEVVRQ